MNHYQNVRVLTGIVTFLSGLLLVTILSQLEARYPVKPTYIWAEVVAGVIAVMVPVTMIRYRCEILLAHIYEQLIIIGFVCCAIPVIAWQLWIAV
jgi:hypothetical protein